MKDDIYLELDSVLEEESWEYLSRECPPLALAVQRGVGKGLDAEEIKFRVLKKVGAHREALAHRCELAANHLWRMKK